MSGEIIETTGSSNGIKEMLSKAGYSDKAIQYYLEKPYMGSLPDADQVRRYPNSSLKLCCEFLQ